MRTPVLLAGAALGLLAVPALAQSVGSPAAGKALFQQRCQACHSVVPGQKGVIAPNLAGVIGRKAGTADFAMYSPALKASGVVWSKPLLEKFLTGPQAMVPGTRMVIQLSEAKDRADIAAFLASTK